MIADEREATIRLFFPHVRQIARRVGRLARISDLDDLIGDGCVGLIRAFDTFDGKRGTSFEVYARRLIVGGMLNGIRRRDPVSERVRRTMRHADERRFALAQERGSLPAFAELERSDPSLRRARAAVFVQSAVSLDASPTYGRDPLIDWSLEPATRALANERDRALRPADRASPGARAAHPRAPLWWRTVVACDRPDVASLAAARLAAASACARAAPSHRGSAVSARVDVQNETQPTLGDNASVQGASVALPFTAPVGNVDPDDRWGNGPALPADHPAWARDALSVSQRARALLARIKPVVVRVIAFWEHRVKSITIGGRTLSVDASGSYRVP
jgi:RNA polymerase sigma factor (sigma-70 family)